MPEPLRGPEPPLGHEVVWNCFNDLDAQRWRTDSGMPLPVRHSDVEAWCRTMRYTLHPTEVLAVLMLDGERRAYERERITKPAGGNDDEDDAE